MLDLKEIETRLLEDYPSLQGCTLRQTNYLDIGWSASLEKLAGLVIDRHIDNYWVRFMRLDEFGQGWYLTIGNRSAFPSLTSQAAKQPIKSTVACETYEDVKDILDSKSDVLWALTWAQKNWDFAEDILRLLDLGFYSDFYPSEWVVKSPDTNTSVKVALPDARRFTWSLEISDTSGSFESHEFKDLTEVLDKILEG